MLMEKVWGTFFNAGDSEKSSRIAWHTNLEGRNLIKTVKDIDELLYK
ncbi:hypothetical protein SAMN05878482_107268 [Peribacillus simplex]|uniref:Uncharacterized protein n=1 Tax=Peribacillus simplex TaxID=1478 RepID=A0A9X8RD22_9BACI|nr:hypothetical protein SAMN05878482_107268 [Peribacillus simplex]